MVHFHDQSHMGEPANMSFMHFSAGAFHVGAIIIRLIGHVIPLSRKPLIRQLNPIDPCRRKRVARELIGSPVRVLTDSIPALAAKRHSLSNPACVCAGMCMRFRCRVFQKAMFDVAWIIETGV